jgi:hypothetical protein
MFIRPLGSRVFSVVALVVALCVGTTVALAATHTVDLKKGQSAQITCPSSGKLSKVAHGANEWTVRCQSTVATPPPTGGDTWSCTEIGYQGMCGAAWDPRGSYADYPKITNTQGGTAGGGPYVGANVWGPVSGETQTLNANSPGDWEVINTTPSHSDGAVTAFPNVGAPYNEQPVTSFSTIISSFDETMPHAAPNVGWAAFDNWFDDWKYEVMIQHDFTDSAPPCDYVAVNRFGGKHGVPVHTWGLCTYGSELIWHLAPDGTRVGDNAMASESTGKVSIKAMTMWLVRHGYMEPDPTITNLSYGWEIVSTDNVPQTFRVNDYSLYATLKAAGSGGPTSGPSS